MEYIRLGLSAGRLWLAPVTLLVLADGSLVTRCDPGPPRPGPATMGGWCRAWRCRPTSTASCQASTQCWPSGAPPTPAWSS
jgi:hypothetical protein